MMITNNDANVEYPMGVWENVTIVPPRLDGKKSKMVTGNKKANKRKNRNPKTYGKRK